MKKTDVTVVNNYKKDDVISFKNLNNKAEYTVYTDSSLKNEIAHFKASSKTQSINVEQLGIKAGTIYIVAKEKGKDPSDKTAVTYKAEQLPAIPAKNVTIVNNNSPKKDSITLKNLEDGMTYNIYNDKLKKKLLKSYTFKKTGSKTYETISINQIGPAAGTLYITVSNSKEGYLESPVTAVSFKGEKLSPIKAKNVKIKNNKGSKDKIELKNLTKGYTYTIYADSKLKKKLASFKAAGKTKKLTVKLSKNKGAVYIVVSKSGYTSSSATKVSYKAERKK